MSLAIPVASDIVAKFRFTSARRAGPSRWAARCVRLPVQRLQIRPGVGHDRIEVMCRGRQPSSACIRAADATSTAGSPGAPARRPGWRWFGTSRVRKTKLPPTQGNRFWFRFRCRGCRCDAMRPGPDTRAPGSARRPGRGCGCSRGRGCRPGGPVGTEHRDLVPLLGSLQHQRDQRCFHERFSPSPAYAPRDVEVTQAACRQTLRHHIRGDRVVDRQFGDTARVGLGVLTLTSSQERSGETVGAMRHPAPQL
jgi:hypothetical protein